MPVSRRSMIFVFLLLFACSFSATANDIQSLDGVTYFGLANANADGELVKKGGVHQVPVKLTLGAGEDGYWVNGMLTKAEFVFDKPEAQDRKFLGYIFGSYGVRDCVVKSDVKFTFKLEGLDGEVSKKMSAAIKNGGDVLAVKLPGTGGKKVRVSLRKVTDDRTGIYYHPDDLLKPLPSSEAIDRAINNFLIFMFHADNSGEFGFFHSYSREQEQKEIEAFSAWLKLKAIKEGKYYSEGEAAGLYTFNKNGSVAVDLTTFDNNASQINTYIGNAYRYGQTTTQPKKKPEVTIKHVEKVDYKWRKVKFKINNLKGLGGNLGLYTTNGTLLGDFSYATYTLDSENGVMHVEAEVECSDDTPKDLVFKFGINVGLVDTIPLSFTAKDIQL